MKLLGKELEEWGMCPNWTFEIDQIWFTNISRNRDAYRFRYESGDYEGTVRDLVMDGNAFRTTWDIIRHVHAVVFLEFFTEEEWQPLIPIVEMALRFNIDYVKCLYAVDPYFKAMVDRYGPCAGYTLMDRMHLEFWQGLFAYDRSCLPLDSKQRRPTYT